LFFHSVEKKKKETPPKNSAITNCTTDTQLKLAKKCFLLTY
jgi:hypothetical protein